MIDLHLRLQAVAGKMLEQGVSAAFIVPSPDFFYVTGVNKHAGERLVGLLVTSDGEAALVTPRMYEAEFRERIALDDFIVWQDGDDPFRLLADELERRGTARRIAVEGKMMAGHLLNMLVSLPQSEFVVSQGLFSPLRMVKTSSELDLMRQAARILEQSLCQVVEQLKPGMTEMEIANMLDFEFRNRGADGISFFPIIGYGANAAKLGYRPQNVRIEPGNVLLMDIGCMYQGYCSDMTRTFFLGRDIPDEIGEVYEIVKRAHAAGLAAANPGTSCADVDAAARSVITQAGYGPQFLHRTGHGMGLEPHEDPFVVSGNAHKLETGEVVTIEPGIYLSGRFGIRIEDAIVIGNDGPELLTSVDRSLQALDIG